ncbi:MAG: hypothetical protein ACI8RZ_006085 [Myxococcota bacterium]|jgi:hypothetical protein
MLSPLLRVLIMPVFAGIFSLGADQVTTDAALV